MPGSSPEKPVDIRSLYEEKEALSRQVKNLIKAESRLYKYQEELDVQLKEYKELYDLNRKLNATFDRKRVFEYAIEYIIRNLEYERVVIFERLEDSGGYGVCALDGYYDPEQKSAVAAGVIVPGDPLLSALQEAGEYLICKAASEPPLLADYRARLLMNEYLIYPLCTESPPCAFLAVGNSRDNAAFYRRVGDAEGALLGIGNLVGLLVSAVENHRFYANMEAALKQERRAELKYRSIFENAVEGIYQTTPEGRILNCNPATAAILGYESPEELMETVVDSGRQLYVDPQRRRELFELMRGGVDVKDFEVEFNRKDGSRRWVLLNTRPVFDENARLLYADGMIQDITERKLAQQAILELNEDLERRVIDRTRDLETANRELRQLSARLESAYSELKSAQSRVLQQEKMASIGQLAAGVAHEINNPMGFIISNFSSLRKYADKLSGFVRLQSEAIEELAVQSGNDDIVQALKAQMQSRKIDFILEDLTHLIDESLDGAERIKNIVQDLKSFSRVDESEFKMADLNAGLESTINIIWSELKYKATLKKEYGALPPTRCNLGQLNQVFMNILINALQAIEGRGEITVRTSGGPEEIHVTISDSGSGIPPEKLDRIFEPFYTTKEVGQGTGLGLSIAYDIIKKHGGDIRVESRPGEGTTMTLSIPVVTE